MSISHLPQLTISKLGSAVAITSPVSLVKELVDNAIDAGADSIEISVSANTVDRIQVRDNGHGISPEDYDVLGRRAYTSKLRTFEELQWKGGKTLGFRGDALASAKTMSKLTITTRTSEDPVAMTLVLDPENGVISSRKPVSRPVGTTIEACDLFFNMPVRKQQAGKDRKKLQEQIRELLYKYALTRPQIRLSLNVPKHEKLTWLYAASKGANVREAVLKVFGNELVSQPNTPASIIRFESFLPVKDADPSKISGKGYFISVDSRPMAASRGTVKKLIDIYKVHLRDCLKIEASSRKLVKPFIQLNIQCVLGSYDPNVTTTKDEVLFANEPKLLALFEDMCRDMYSPADKGSSDFITDRDDDIEGLMQIQELSASDSNVEDDIPDDISSLGIFPDPEPINAPEHHQGDIADPSSFLRTGWIVDMARSKTGSPDGDTQTIMLGNRPNIAEYLDSERVEQTQREQTDPWSLAKTAAERRASKRAGDSNNIVQVGTPPPDPSPLKRPFRVPARAVPGKQSRRGLPREIRKETRDMGTMEDHLSQSRLTFSARKGMKPLGNHEKSLGHAPFGLDGNDIPVESFVPLGHVKRPTGRVSPSPTERAMHSALERLNTLRPSPEDVGHFHDIEKIEERGRPGSRRLSTALPVTSYGAFLRERPPSRSRLGSRTHKRMKSDILPLERSMGRCSSLVQLFSVGLDEMKQGVLKATNCDLYVLMGLQESAFAMEPAEMDDVTNRVQEVVGMWATETHDVELDLEINVGEELMGKHMAVTC